MTFPINTVNITFVVLLRLYLLGLEDIQMIELDDQRFKILEEDLLFPALLAFPFYGLYFEGKQFFILIYHGQNSRHTDVTPKNLFDFVLNHVEFVDSLDYLLLLKLCLLASFNKISTDQVYVVKGVVVSAQKVQVYVEILYEFLAKTVINAFGLLLNYLAQNQHGLVQQNVQLLVLLFLTMFLYFLSHCRVKTYDLVGQVKKYYEKSFDCLKFIRVLLI